jgi:hypothetical protein
MAPKVFDNGGQERDMAWLLNKYGDVTISASEYPEAFRVVELREQIGDAALVVRLLNEEGQLQGGVTVIRYWPDAPKLPEWPPPPERWFSQGVHGETNDEGVIGFGMGRGDYYDPALEQRGATSIWVGFLGTGSECVGGLGMLGGSNHAHINVTFQHSAEPEPPGPGGDELERIALALESIAARWPFD